MLKKWPHGFIYVDRAQTEQQLNLVHDRGIYFTFKTCFRGERGSQEFGLFCELKDSRGKTPTLLLRRCQFCLMHAEIWWEPARSQFMVFYARTLLQKGKSRYHLKTSNFEIVLCEATIEKHIRPFDFALFLLVFSSGFTFVNEIDISLLVFHPV